MLRLPSRSFVLGCEVGDAGRRFESDSGELLAVVTNGERAMVMLLREPGDAGEHAVDETAGTSTSSGYVLANGQVDTYADCDTVRLADALELRVGRYRGSRTNALEVEDRPADRSRKAAIMGRRQLHSHWWPRRR